MLSRCPPWWFVSRAADASPAAAADGNPSAGNTGRYDLGLAVRPTTPAAAPTAMASRRAPCPNHGQAAVPSPNLGKIGPTGRPGGGRRAKKPWRSAESAGLWDARTLHEQSKRDWSRSCRGSRTGLKPARRNLDVDRTRQGAQARPVARRRLEAARRCSHRIIGCTPCGRASGPLSPGQSGDLAGVRLSAAARACESLNGCRARWKRRGFASASIGALTVWRIARTGGFGHPCLCLRTSMAVRAA